MTIQKYDYADTSAPIAPLLGARQDRESLQMQAQLSIIHDASATQPGEREFWCTRLLHRFYKRVAILFGFQKKFPEIVKNFMVLSDALQSMCLSMDSDGINSYIGTIPESF